MAQKKVRNKGVCPLCSHTRKPKNQKAKCASYDWNVVSVLVTIATLLFQLHTYQRKGASNKEYIRPVEHTDYNIPRTKVAEWFKSRGISTDTLINLQVGEGVEYMPQTGKKENTIHFYFIMQVIN